MNLMEFLRERYGDQLRFEQGCVAWDKTLLRTIRRLGFDLKLEDYATRVILYRGEERLGEVDYKRITIEDDDEMNAAYDVMLLDLSPFHIETD